MAATDYNALLRDVHAEADKWPINVDMKNPEKTRGIMNAVKERIRKRQQEEAAKARRREREAATLARAAEDDANASIAAAQEQGAAYASNFQRVKQQVKDAFKTDGTLGPEPDVFGTALVLPKELPAPSLNQVAGMAELHARMLSLAGEGSEAACLTMEDAAAVATCRGLLPMSCPDEATARALFEAVCFAGDGALAAAAYRTLLRWAGVPEPMEAFDGQLLLDAFDLEASPIVPTIAWVPGAADFLSALQQLGCNRAGSTKATAGSNHAMGGTAAASTSGEATDAATTAPPQPAAAPVPAHNLQLLLRLMAVLLQLSSHPATSSKRLAVSLPEGHGRSLLLALLHLHMDAAVRAVALPQLQSAIAALIDAFGDTEWGRVAAAVAAQFGEPLGPSHRASVRLLRELPGRGRRVRGLRSAGALALLRMLVHTCSKGNAAAPAQRASARARGSAPTASPAEVQQLLGGKGLLLELAHGRSGKDAEYWALLSLLDAADLVLWGCVDAPGGNTLDEDTVEWLQQWMQRLARELRGKTLSHFVRTRLSELENHYAYCTQLGCAGGAEGAQREEL